MGKDIELLFLLVQIGCSYIIVVIINGKSIFLGHGQRQGECPAGSLAIRFSLLISCFLAVNSAQETDIINHFLSVGVNIFFDMLLVHCLSFRYFSNSART